MTEINLLPWREQKRDQVKKKFTTLILITIISTIAVVFLVDYYASSLVDGQMNRNNRLQTEITTFDKQIIEIKHLKQIRDSLISRMRIVHVLQSTRILTVHLLDELIKVLPDGVYLTEMKRTADKVVVKGYAESNSNVSILMRNIQDNPWIQQPVLTEIKKPDEASTVEKELKLNEFNLSFILKPKTQAKVSNE